MNYTPDLVELKEGEYAVVIEINGRDLFEDIPKFYPMNGLIQYINGAPSFKNGEYTYFDVTFRVVNYRDRVVAIFKNQEEFNTFRRNNQLKNDEYLNTRIRPLFKFGTYGWSRVGSYGSFVPENYIGYTHYYEEVMKLIDGFTENCKILEKMGLTQALNILLYGTPGMGKSTFVKMVGTALNLPIYAIDYNGIRNGDARSVFNPQRKKNDLKIVLFEDFDRYLTCGVPLSEILNALDGVETCGPVVRFFTGNDHRVITGTQALSSRIAVKFGFNAPKYEDLYTQLERVIGMFFEAKGKKTKLDKKKMERICKLAETFPNVSIRSFSNFCVRNLFSENPVDEMLKNIKDLKWESTSHVGV